MNSNLKSKLSSFLNQVVIFLLIAYTFFMLSRVIYFNYKLNKQTESIKAQISEIEAENANLANLITYYQSDSFREVEARRQLNLKKPEETEVMVPAKKEENFSEEIQSQTDQIADKKQVNQNSNSALWRQYFFK